jgi:hypothetical protein
MWELIRSGVGDNGIMDGSSAHQGRAAGGDNDDDNQQCWNGVRRRSGNSR